MARRIIEPQELFGAILVDILYEVDCGFISKLIGLKFGDKVTIVNVDLKPKWKPLIYDGLVEDNNIPNRLWIKNGEVSSNDYLPYVIGGWTNNSTCWLSNYIIGRLNSFDVASVLEKFDWPLYNPDRSGCRPIYFTI